jgi:hypothetical protein
MNSLPIQKVSSSQKTKQWFKDCALACVSLSFSESNDISLSATDKQTNLNLYDGKIDVKELKSHFDTMKLFDKDYVPSFKNFAVVRDKIDLIYGEYLERNEEYGVAVTDANSLSIKTEERRQKAAETLQEALNGKIKDEEELRLKIRGLRSDRYISTIEKAANKLLNIVKKTNNIPNLKAEGYREALILAQAIFFVGVRNDNVFVRKCNPLNTYTVRSGMSNDVKDAEIISEVRYLPIGKIVDEYGEYIESTSQFNKLVNGDDTGLGDNSGLSRADFNLFHQVVGGEQAIEFMKVGDTNTHGSLVDSNGNIRVVDTTWAGFRKIIKRKYYDEFGETRYDYVSEHYTADKEKGEELTVRYVKEWHEATVIGGDFVIKYGIKEPRIASPNNPFESYSGYVGGYFNVVNNKAVSMVSLMAPYIYLINLLYARAEDILSKNFGKIIELDLHNIPEGWDVKKVLRYMKLHGVRVKDSFKAGSKGMAQNKLAGMYNSSTKPLDMEVGGSIVYILQMIDKTEGQIAKITGITPQRMGSISNRELVGNVERSQIQSSHITEYWFNRYEQIELDLNYLILNTAKQLVKKGVVFQSILDDYSYAVFNEATEDFNNASLDLFPVNSRKFKKLSNILEESVVQGLANGQVNYTELIKMFRANNSFDLIVEAQKMQDEKDRKIKDAAEQESKGKIEQIAAQTKQQSDLVTLKGNIDLQLEQIRSDNKLQLRMLELDASDFRDDKDMKRDENANGIKDDIELEKEKMKSDMKQKELDIKIEQMRIDQGLKLRELAIKEREINSRPRN